MITELVLFALPEGMTREQVTAFFQQNAPKWRANPDLIRKNYLYEPETRRGGGAYLWPTSPPRGGRMTQRGAKRSVKPSAVSR
jgi:hypothetical protein